MKLILKFFKLLLITLVICIMLLTIVAKIPTTQKLKENCKKASEIYYEIPNEYPEIQPGRKNTSLDYYADSISLNIIYSLNSDKPLSSILEAKYYAEKNKIGTECFEKLIKENKEANTDYLRYWHGYIILLKPLIMFFTIQQIHIINAVILMILIAIIIIQLWFIDKRAIVAFILGLIATNVWIVPQTFEYVWVYMIIFITTIIVLKIDNGDNSKIYPILFVSGMLTCFFDFLTVEILSLLLPLIMIMIKKNKISKNEKLKDLLKFILISIIVWGIAYVSMYFLKWIIASIVLNRNCIFDAMQKAQIRINQTVGERTKSQMLVQALKRNFLQIYPINLIKNKIIAYILIPTIEIIFILINRYQKKDNAYLWGMLVLSVLPYIRYGVLLNHSFKHYFFTERIQIVSVITYVMVILNTLKKFSLKKVLLGENNGRKTINNISSGIE